MCVCSRALQQAPVTLCSRLQYMLTPTFVAVQRPLHTASIGHVWCNTQAETLLCCVGAFSLGCVCDAVQLHTPARLLAGPTKAWAVQAAQSLMASHRWQEGIQIAKLQLQQGTHHSSSDPSSSSSIRRGSSSSSIICSRLQSSSRCWQAWRLKTLHHSLLS